MSIVLSRSQKDSAKIFKQSIGFLIFFFIIFSSRGSRSEEINRCISKETCGKCIEEDPKCVWCTQEDFTDPRCDYAANLDSCSDQVNPITSVKNEKDYPLTNKKIGETREEEAVQIKPQEIRIKLRPNAPETFFVHFRLAEDYPVDLYFVMDLSHSMKDDKEKLAVLGNKFAKEMETITSNFRLGFGSFVDKVVAPYVAVHPNMINAPCAGCAKPYGFKNHMSLSSETEKFAKEVRKAPVSGNLDSPEGTMDAIMQAVVCEKIGWRSNSRKLLVVSTDNDYHYAGDGKLGGIIEPNDCQCHLDANGFYSKSTEQDYPSLSQVNRKIKEKNVNLIFAVTRDQVEHYQNLSRRLLGSTTGELADDSSNVVQLVRAQYEAIRSAVEMRDNAPRNIQVSYSSTCLGEENKQRNECKGLKVLQNVTFAVTVKLSSCPVNKDDWNTSFDIKPVGLDENLRVHVEMMCECDCEKPGKEERNSIKCSSGNGTYECGVCSCNEYRYGKTCECQSGESLSSTDNNECVSGPDSQLCSNRGECQCGKCFCDTRDNPEEKYYGKYCECNNFSCDQVDHKICNGHGTCNCGRCVCEKGWSGVDCTCKENIEDCMDNNGDICGDKGRCECGSCKCTDTYFGQFCDDCPSCQGKCGEYSACAECFLSRRDQHLSENDCEKCDSKAVELVEKIEVNETLMERSCSLKDAENCHVLFKYRMDDRNRAMIYIQETRKCPEPAPVLAIVSGTAGSIVAAGVILLLMWKILTTIHDRRELEKFEKERKNAKWGPGENPLFVPSTSTFQNPAYGGGK